MIKFVKSYFLILALCLTTSFLTAQSYPPADSVYKATKNWCRKAAKSQYKLGKQIDYIPGFFTQDRRVECISVVKCRYKKKDHYFAVLWKQNASGVWSKQGWTYAGFNKMEAGNIDNDTYTELFITQKVSLGYKIEKNHLLLSIKGGTENQMFTWNDFDYVKIGYIQQNMKPGEILSVAHNIGYEDLNKDGKFEITDHITEKKLIDSCCEHHFEYEFKYSQKNYRLVDGQYVEITDITK